MNKKLVIWDFDGVICDSLLECITITRVAAVRLQDAKLTVTEKNIGEICNQDVVAALYKKMQTLRPFIAKGQDYLWQYFNLELFPPSISGLQEYRAIFDQLFQLDLDRKYESAFYESRKIVQSVMGQQYFTLFKPYPGALYAFRSSLLRDRNYICTARDQKGVLLLFGDHAIEFPRDKIYSKDFNGNATNTGQGKMEQILRILDCEGGKEQEFLLIEDQVTVPLELKKQCSGMSVVYAAYGYGLDQDWGSADLNRVAKVSDPSGLIYAIY